MKKVLLVAAISAVISGTAIAQPGVSGGSVGTGVIVQPITPPVGITLPIEIHYPTIPGNGNANPYTPPTTPGNGKVESQNAGSPSFIVQPITSPGGITPPHIVYHPQPPADGYAYPMVGGVQTFNIVQ